MKTCGKRIFIHEIDAKIALYKAKRSDSVHRAKIPVRYYKCEEGCKGYHLTSMKEWNNVKDGKIRIPAWLRAEGKAYLRRQVENAHKTGTAGGSVPTGADGTGKDLGAGG
jgi:hypothetical protein